MKISKKTMIGALISFIIFFQMTINAQRYKYKNERTLERFHYGGDNLEREGFLGTIGIFENQYRLRESNKFPQKVYGYLSWYAWALRIIWVKGSYAYSGEENFTNDAEYAKFLSEHENETCTRDEVGNIIAGVTDNWEDRVNAAYALMRSNFGENYRDGCSPLAFIYEQELGITGRPLYCPPGNIELNLELSAFVDDKRDFIRVHLLMEYLKNCLNYKPKTHPITDLRQEQNKPFFRNLLRAMNPLYESIEFYGRYTDFFDIVWRFEFRIRDIIGIAEAEATMLRFGTKFVESKGKIIEDTEARLSYDKIAIIYLIYSSMGDYDHIVAYNNFKWSLDLKKIFG